MIQFSLSKDDTVYKYTLIEKIGGGNFGEVWLANDNSLARRFAIKLLNASQTSIDNELMEARIGNRMAHDNLVQVHVADVVNISGCDTVIIAMDYLENGSIDKKACAGNFVPIQIAVKAVIDILRGLEYLHDNGFYHNDIKPQNILIGANNEAILTDYGISGAALDGSAVQPKNRYLPHQAPETCSNNLIDEKSEIYQAGITLFRLVNGLNTVTECFQSHTRDEYEALVRNGKLLDKAGWLPFVPNSLKKIIRKATHNDHSQRYQTVLEMRRALEKLCFPNSWACVADGTYESDSAKYIFTFEIVARKNGRYDFNACKTAKNNQRKTRIGKFSSKDLTGTRLENVKRKFMTSVTEGKI